VLSSTTASTPSVSCSPRWIVYRNTRALDGRGVSVSSPRECLEACIANSSCVSVEWDIAPTHGYECWMHDRHRRHSPRASVTQFEIVRQCYQKPGTWRRHLLFMPPPTDRCVGGITFCCCRFFEFFTMRNFWDSSADCRQTFPRVRKWVYLRNWVRNLETYQPSLGAQNMKIRTRFWTTSRLGGE